MARTIWCPGIREREFDRKPDAIPAKVDPVDQRNLNGRMIALFKTGDRVFAVDNRCPPYESVSRSAPSDVEIQTSRWTFGLQPGGVRPSAES
jgi:nitrite reductase/ring-hydroxylating ferredoxin subunit